MNTRIYESDQDFAELIDPIDVDEIAVVGFDWSPWMTSIGESTIDEQAFTGSSGVVVGDGATGIAKGGMSSTTPSAPTISTHTTAAHVWVDSTVEEGDEVTVTNTIRVGSRVQQRTLRMEVVRR